MKLSSLHIVIFLFSFIAASAENYTLSGKVYDAKTKEPLYYAVVNLASTHHYDITTEEGEFNIKDVPEGEYEMLTSLLGYVQHKEKIKITADKKDFKIYIMPSSLEVEEVVVTATSTQSDNGSTTYKMSNEAIKQIQAVSINDIMSLLPGGKIGQTNMNSAAQVNLRDAGGSANNSFGTAIIVDGNQMSNDANMQAYNSSKSTSGGSAGTVIRKISLNLMTLLSRGETGGVSYQKLYTHICTSSVAYIPYKNKKTQ